MSPYDEAHDFLQRASDLMTQEEDLLIVALIGDVLDLIAAKRDPDASQH